MTKELLFDNIELKEEFKKDELESTINHKELVSEIKREIKENLITQFGLSWYFDRFKEGGGVDTINNARIFDKEKDKWNEPGYKAPISDKLQDVMKNREKYDGKDYHDRNKNFRDAKKDFKEQQAQGTLKDGYTGKTLDGKFDAEHIKSSYGTHYDTAEVLKAGGKNKSQSEITKVLSDKVNSKDNLIATDPSINRSKKEKNIGEYLQWSENEVNRLNEKRENAVKNGASQEEISKIDEEISKRTAHDKDLMRELEKKQKERERREAIDYYTSPEFRNELLKNSAKQAKDQAIKQAIGIVVYEVSDVFISSVNEVVASWREYDNLWERAVDLKDKIVYKMNDIKERLSIIMKQVGENFFSGGVAGFTSAIINTAINTLKKTTEKFAKLLNDVAHGIVKAIKVLCNRSIPKEERWKQALKIFSVIVATSLGVIVTEWLMKSLFSWIPEEVKDAVSTVFEIIIVGSVSVILVFAALNIGRIIKKVVDAVKALLGIGTVSVETLEKNYNIAISKIDKAYQEFLLNIKELYKKERSLQALLTDMSLSVGERFEVSIEYARFNNVPEEKILKNVDDIDNFFLN